VNNNLIFVSASLVIVSEIFLAWDVFRIIALHKVCDVVSMVIQIPEHRKHSLGWPPSTSAVSVLSRISRARAFVCSGTRGSEQGIIERAQYNSTERNHTFQSRLVATGLAGAQDVTLLMRLLTWRDLRDIHLLQAFMGALLSFVRSPRVVDGSLETTGNTIDILVSYDELAQGRSQKEEIEIDQKTC
jgi:hypothetical protein